MFFWTLTELVLVVLELVLFHVLELYRYKLSDINTILHSSKVKEKMISKNT